MLQTVGEIAGKIWNYLDENGESTLTSLKKELDIKPEQATLSLGWLAREGKVEMEKKGNSVKVSLVK